MRTLRQRILTEAYARLYSINNSPGFGAMAVSYLLCIRVSESYQLLRSEN